VLRVWSRKRAAQDKKIFAICDFPLKNAQKIFKKIHFSQNERCAFGHQNAQRDPPFSQWPHGLT
jgi:hypothetical protein